MSATLCCLFALLIVIVLFLAMFTYLIYHTDETRGNIWRGIACCFLFALSLTTVIFLGGHRICTSSQEYFLDWLLIIAFVATVVWASGCCGRWRAEADLLKNNS